MDPKYYENDYMIGKYKEMEFVRSPFYDLAKSEKMNAEQAAQLIDEVALKLTYLEGLDLFLQPPQPNRENVAYKRYADKTEDPAARALFQFPSGQPYRIVNNGELFRIQR